MTRQPEIHSNWSTSEISVFRFRLFDGKEGGRKRQYHFLIFLILIKGSIAITTIIIKVGHLFESSKLS